MKHKRLIDSLSLPTLFVVLIWSIEVLKFYFQWDLRFLGVHPREFEGLLGVVTSPLVHSGLDHLFSNMLPLFVMSGMLFYFYRPIALPSILTIYLLTGILVWLFARPNAHIGASGVVYGLAGFLVGAGLFSKKRQTLALSLVIVLLYGSMIWGIFPIQPGVSWESHLAGGLVGFATAFFYRQRIYVEGAPPEAPRTPYVPSRPFLPSDFFEPQLPPPPTHSDGYWTSTTSWPNSQPPKNDETQ